MMRRYLIRALPLLLLAGCGLSPVSSRIEPGKDPFLILVGEGANGSTDLFLAQPGGGKVLQLTYTPVIELAPALTPDGTTVAFLRTRDTLPGTHRDITILNITSGSETRLKLPAEAGIPLKLAWSEDFQSLFVATSAGPWRLPVPPLRGIAERLVGDAAVSADSALTPWVGQPRFAPVVTCQGVGVCLALPSGDTVQLSTSGRDAFPWGTDSVAWFEGSRLVVRSLAGGSLRQVDWVGAPSHPRQASYAWMITWASSPYGRPEPLENQ